MFLVPFYAPGPFDDYPGFQPKITPPKHFSRQCIGTPWLLGLNPQMISSVIFFVESFQYQPTITNSYFDFLFYKINNH
jgi:hypothetical protein